MRAPNTWTARPHLFSRIVVFERACPDHTVGTDQLAKIYDTAFNGVTKAVAAQGEAYCSDTKVAQIKEALTRHLAGDYTPPPQAPAQDEGIFGSLGSANSGDSEYAKKMQANPTLEH